MATRVRPISEEQLTTVTTLVHKEKLPTAPVEVVKQTPGPVTWLQKIARYYKGIIAFLGTLLALLTAPEIGPLQHLLPDGYQHWLTVGIGAATVLLTFLKENEHWFPDAAVQPVSTSE